MAFARFKSLALASIALTAAFGLAACGDEPAADGTQITGEAIAPIAPPEGKTWGEVITRNDQGGYVMGNPDAPIKLTEFGALSCSHCAHFAEEASAQIANDFVATGRVSYELRLFMLNPYDIAASLLATCGSDEAVIPLSEQFWAWQPNMFANLDKATEQQMQAVQNLPPAQRFETLASIAGMNDFFAARGISLDQGKACLTDEQKATDLAEQTAKDADDFDITGTPSFLINGSKVDINTWPEIKTRLENLGAR